MAAPPKYPTPSAQVVPLARDARRRGLSWEEFWEAARRPGLPPITWTTPPELWPGRCIIWPHDSADRAAQMEVIDSVADGIRRAYERQAPLRRERALLQLGPLLPLMDEAAARSYAGNGNGRAALGSAA